MTEPEFSEVIQRLVGGGNRRDHEAIEYALDVMTDAKVEQLAGLAGQSMSELRESFQLLPLGSRITLQRAGVIEQQDEGRPRFRVEVLDGAIDLVEAAVARVQARRLADSDSLLAQEVARIWDNRYEIKRSAGGNVRLDPALVGADRLGTFDAPGEVIKVEPGANLVVCKVMNKARKYLLAEVDVDTADMDVPFDVGQRLELNFSVVMPKTKGLFAKNRGPATKLFKNVEAKPGYILVHCDAIPAQDMTVVSFSTPASEGSTPNAVAKLQSVSAVD